MTEQKFGFYSDKMRDFEPMEIENLDLGPGKFLTALFELSKGDVSRQVSMYNVGETIGMDRDEAARAAEVLMGNGLVEIKTLSGGIGITEAAVAAIKETSGAGDEKSGGPQALPKAPIISAESKSAIDTVLTAIKYHINELGLPFDAVAGILADIKTIEAQLTSPSPKTPIIRECFVSLKSWTDKSSHDEIKGKIKSILGN
jgi:hypothetical protein